LFFLAASNFLPKKVKKYKEFSGFGTIIHGDIQLMVNSIEF